MSNMSILAEEKGFGGPVDAVVFIPYDGCTSAPCTGSLLFFTVSITKDVHIYYKRKYNLFF